MKNAAFPRPPLTGRPSGLSARREGARRSKIHGQAGTGHSDDEGNPNSYSRWNAAFLVASGSACVNDSRFLPGVESVAALPPTRVRSDPTSRSNLAGRRSPLFSTRRTGAPDCDDPRTRSVIRSDKDGLWPTIMSRSSVRPFSHSRIAGASEPARRMSAVSSRSAVCSASATISAVVRARGRGLVAIRSSFKSSRRKPRPISRMRCSPLRGQESLIVGDSRCSPPRSRSHASTHTTLSSGPRICESVPKSDLSPHRGFWNGLWVELGKLLRDSYGFSFPARRLLAVDPEGQALGTAPGLDELGEAERADREPGVLQGGGQLGCPPR